MDRTQTSMTPKAPGAATPGMGAGNVPFAPGLISGLIANHRDMVSSALMRRLASENCEILTVPRDELDLMD